MQRENLSQALASTQELQNRLFFPHMNMASRLFLNHALYEDTEQVWEQLLEMQMRQALHMQPRIAAVIMTCLTNH